MIPGAPPPPEYRTPAMPFYVDDWFSSGRLAIIPPEGEALFIRMLGKQWVLGALPADLDGVMAIVGFRRAYEAVWPLVSALFEPVAGHPGWIRNARLEEIRADWKRLRDQKAGAGRASAEARKERRGNGAPNGAGNEPPNGTANGDPNGGATSHLPSSIFHLPSPNFQSPPAAAPPPPPEGGPPAAARKRRTKGGKPAVDADTRRLLDFIAAIRDLGAERPGPALEAPGEIPARLAEGYTVYDCLMVFWRARRRWKAGHNQVSPFRAAHFGVLLDEAREDAAKGWKVGERRFVGFNEVHDLAVNQGLKGDALAAAIWRGGFTRDGRVDFLDTFARTGQLDAEQEHPPREAAIAVQGGTP